MRTLYNKHFFSNIFFLSLRKTLREKVTFLLLNPGISFWSMFRLHITIEDRFGTIWQSKDWEESSF